MRIVYILLFFISISIKTLFCISVIADNDEKYFRAILAIKNLVATIIAEYNSSNRKPPINTAGWAPGSNHPDLIPHFESGIFEGGVILQTFSDKDGVYLSEIYSPFGGFLLERTYGEDLKTITSELFLSESLKIEDVTKKICLKSMGKFVGVYEKSNFYHVLKVGGIEFSSQETFTLTRLDLPNQKEAIKRNNRYEDLASKFEDRVSNK